MKKRTEKEVKFEAWLKRVLELSGDAHNIFTPFELCEEVIAKIPSLDGKILVVANLEFLYTLSINIDSMEDVYFATPNAMKAKVAAKWIPESNIIMYDSVISQEDVGDMKFDVVISNPPYQDADNMGGKKTAIIPLWFRFTKQAFQICKPNGVVAFITPSSWMSLSNKIHNEIVSHELIHVKLFEKTPFPAVMTTASVWVAINIPTQSSTFPLIIGKKTFTLSPGQFIPAKSKSFALKLSILEKTLSANNTKFDFIIDSRNHSVSKAYKLSKFKNDVNKYPVVHTYTTTLWSSEQDDLHGIPKVLISKTGSLNKALVDVESSIGQNTLALVTETTQQATLALGVIKSKLYKFMIGCTVHSSTTSPKVYKALPAVDLTRSWTDEELYAHFDLTEEEIKLIEVTIS